MQGASEAHVPCKPTLGRSRPRSQEAAWGQGGGTGLRVARGQAAGCGVRAPGGGARARHESGVSATKLHI